MGIMNQHPRPAHLYRPVGQATEYGNVWVDYEAKCHDCGKWTESYGEYTVEVDGEHLPVCDTCGAAAWQGIVPA